MREIAGGACLGWMVDGRGGGKNFLPEMRGGMGVEGEVVRTRMRRGLWIVKGEGGIFFGGVKLSRGIEGWWGRGCEGCKLLSEWVS